MGLRTRTLFLVSLVMATLFIALFFIARPSLQSAFDKLERDRAALDGERLAGAISEESDRLARSAADYAPRGVTYRYMQGDTADLTAELTEDALTRSGINVFLLIDENGRLISSWFVDLGLGTFTETDQAVVDAVLSARGLTDPGDPRFHVATAIDYGSGVMLVASHSITTSDMYGVPEGTLVVGRYLDPAEIVTIAAKTRLPVTAFPVDSAGAAADPLPDAEADMLAMSEEDGSVAVRIVDGETIASYTTLRDLNGRPVMLLRADAPRDVHAVGRTALVAFAGALALCCLAAVIVVNYTINRTVLGRIARLSADMAGVASHGDLGARVGVEGRDEIGSLALGINEALAAIEEGEREVVRARNDLEVRVVERTEELRTSEWRYRSLVDRLADGVFQVDPDGYVTFANRRAEELTERSLAEIVGAPFVDLLSPASAEEIASRMRAGTAHLAGLTIEAKMGDASCGPAPVELRSAPLFDEAGVLAGTQWIARDVADRKRFEEQLVHMANHDYLTGLFNRQFFESALDLELAESRRTGGGGAILWLDVDDFKEVNDTLGHRAGDEILVSLATRLRTEVRESTVLSRLGGDEFAVLMPGAAAEEAEQVAERLLGIINSQTYTAVGHAVRLSASIGVVMYPEHGSTPAELLANADVSMYLAKASGRSCVHMHAMDEALRGEMRSRMTWNERLTDALHENRFRVFAQPVLDVRTGVVVRHELLIRMMVDDELVSPAEFLPAAERLGIIRDIDRWMIHQAVKLLSMNALDGSSIEVNLSGKAFGDPELPAMIRRALETSGVEAQRLGFEITETAAIADMAKAQRLICMLKELGCRFSLDDFGSGFSSFYYLKHLQIDCLKVDGSFIRSLPDSPQDQHLVRGIVELCRGLGVEIAVEYVEDQRTLDLVRELGVDLAQGYHIGRPAPVEQCTVEEADPNVR